MTREERVAAAQWVTNKQNGVNAVQQRHSLPSSDAFIAANPDKFTRLASPGDCFIDQSSVAGVRE